MEHRGDGPHRGRASASSRRGGRRSSTRSRRCGTSDVRASDRRMPGRTGAVDRVTAPAQIVMGWEIVRALIASGLFALAAAAAGCNGRSTPDPGTIAPDPSTRATNARTAAAQASAFRDGAAAARDEARALQLFGEACEGGLAKACGDLGAMYADGVGVAARRLARGPALPERVRRRRLRRLLPPRRDGPRRDGDARRTTGARSSSSRAPATGRSLGHARSRATWCSRARAR